jgi:hypothetical protein
VSRALTHVEWIEQRSIKADRGTRRVAFDINDKSKFSLDEIAQALPSKYRSGLKIFEGP